jgi:hypothetical protein
MVTTTSADAIQWQRTFSLVAGLIREEFTTQYPFSDDGEGSPATIALRDAVYAFPFRADVLLLDAGSFQAVPHYSSTFVEPAVQASSIWSMVAHHLGDTSPREITFHGICALADLDNYLPLLSQRFALDDDSYADAIRRLQFSGCWDSDASEIVDFVSFDIREHPASYAKYLSRNFLSLQSDGLISRFAKKTDFNELYGLVDDPVLSLEELTRIDPTTALFAREPNGQSPSIEDRQKDAAGIQLIPKVPQDVRRTFHRAKEAYVFGYFRYAFFTMAVHYAALALEAAIKARWTIGLPQSVTVLCGTDAAQMHFPSHTKIVRLSAERRWKFKPVLVDGKRFPATMNALLQWLVQEKIATKWESKQLRHGLDLRNVLSHVEHSPTDIPSAAKLRFVADSINTLFHGLP